MPIKDIDKRRKYHRKYQRKYFKEKLIHNKKYKNRKSLYMLKYKKKHKEYFKVQGLARRRTKLESNCLFCNTTKDLQRHHPNYDEPLRVVTLCRRCHYDLHYYMKVV